MRDITNIDWADHHTKIVESDPMKMAKQKVFFLQNGIEYGASGVACNAAQVKKYYNDVAQEAQDTATAAVEAANSAQAAAEEALKRASPPAKKAAVAKSAK